MYELKPSRLLCLNHSQNEIVISYVLRTCEPPNRPYLIMSIVNQFDWPSDAAVELAYVIRLLPDSERVGLRENGELIHPTNTSRGVTCFARTVCAYGKCGLRRLSCRQVTLSATRAD